jgi:hypothetical protein
MNLRLTSAVSLVLIPILAGAQDSTSREAPSHVTVGSDSEDYLRYLQDAGIAAVYPWSLREFSPWELEKMSVSRGSHPWSGKAEYHDVPSRFSLRLLPVNVVFRYNSAFPYGSNDGAVWAGKGFTSALDFGFTFKVGPLSGTVNPIAFRAENQPFDIAPSGVTDPTAFADPAFPTQVDRPRRFGDAAYSRFDPGESTLQLAALGLTAGVSSANMSWGPMELYPYILGGNAPGFPHVFVGTNRPLSIWIARIHAKIVWGELQQSAFSPVTGTSYYSSVVESGTKRFMSGIVGTIQPRGVPGLELGGARFFHSVWPREGLPRSYFTKPFEAIFKKALGSAGFADGSDAGVGDNQLASVFARWVFPSSGFEFYGEYGREDHNYDFRDFIQEPDHSRAYGMGLRKVVTADSSHLTAVRAELINFQLPTLARHRGEGGTYTHTVIRQGHTNRGQLLGADTGIGTGAGSTLAWDSYSPRGRWTIAWVRTVRQEDGKYYLNGVENQRSSDVLNALSAERATTSTTREFASKLSLVRELNRNFDHDSWNVNIQLGVRYHFR